MSTFHYRLFNLRIRSELEIPEIPLTMEDGLDVNICFGAVPEHLDKSHSSGILYEASPGEFLLKLPNIGRFLAINGNSVIIDRKINATDDELRLFLLGSVMGAILHQRGFLPLHGSSVRFGNTAIIIIGNSAAGKSTLAAALDHNGYPLIADDLSAISADPEFNCVIHPGIPYFKLWKDVSDLLHPDKDFHQIRPQLEKYLVPSKSQFTEEEKIPISKIILLTTGNIQIFETEEISGAEKLKLLREHVFRDQLIKDFGMMENYFNLLSYLANQVSLYHIKRPVQPLRIEELVDLTMHLIDK